MNPMTRRRLIGAFDNEWQQFRVAEARGDVESAFAHLERAHILGQPLTRLHVRSHIGMLRIAWKRRAVRELLGQLSRIVAASVFTTVWVPVGNTGGSNVSAFKPMPLPADLAELFKDDSRQA